MWRPDFAALPEPPDLGEFHIRVANREDAPALATLLTAAFGEEWSLDRVNRDLLKAADVRRTYVVEGPDGIVATASAQTVPDRWPEAGVVHWVGADPVHAGKGFGYAVSLAVLHDHRDAGHKDAYLLTDDFRKPAIRTYLKLGFQPVYADPDHEAAWSAIYAYFRA